MLHKPKTVIITDTESILETHLSFKNKTYLQNVHSCTLKHKNCYLQEVNRI